MNNILTITLLSLSSFLFGQQEEFKTIFTPYSVTYNGSKNPAECFESVDCGVLINNKFFVLPAAPFQKLSDELNEKEVLIEVIFFEEAREGSGAVGVVSKIIFNGKTYYSQD